MIMLQGIALIIIFFIVKYAIQYLFIKYALKSVITQIKKEVMTHVKTELSNLW